VRVLVVYSHPNPGSFVAALDRAVVGSLTTAGHDVHHIDLHSERFDPAFSLFERLHHTGPPGEKTAEFPFLAAHVDALRWCDHLVLVYPTWWSGLPAMLKGWVDRTFMQGVAWDLPEGANRIRPLLTNIGGVTVVTTHGSSKFVNMLEGESGKRTVSRSMRLMFRRRAGFDWVALYGADTCSAAKRDAFMRRVQRRMERLH